MSSMDAMLKKLLNDPALVASLEKLVKKNSSELAKAPKEKKLKELGNPMYINEVTSTCKLCGSIHTINLCMAYDPAEKLYRVFARHLDNIWPALPTFKLRQRQTTCNCCAGVLLNQTKEDLIIKLIHTAENNVICQARVS